VLSSLAPARRRLVLLALVLVLAVAVAVIFIVLRSGDTAPSVADDRPGPVLLVPGYGGSTDSLQVLATTLRQRGRDAQVLPLPGNGTGDLTEQARALSQAAGSAMARSRAASVDVVGYSAGGVVARLWVAQLGGARVARRVVTLGSPQHGTSVAVLAGGLAPSLCPTACQQLDPNSDLLRTLNARDETPAGPTFVSIWSTVDQVVTPPESARLDGALNLTVQSVCASSTVAHGDLPRDPVSSSMVVTELAAGAPRTLLAADCAAMSR